MNKVKIKRKSIELYMYYENITKNSYLFLIKVFQHKNCTKDIPAKVSLDMNRFISLLLLQFYPSKDYKFSGPIAKISIKKLCRQHDFIKLLNV